MLRAVLIAMSILLAGVLLGGRASSADGPAASSAPKLATAVGVDACFRAATWSPTPRLAFGGRPRLGIRSLPSLDTYPQTPDVLSATPALSLYRTNWAVGPAGARRVDLSRADCALKGFGRGASLGLWLGALAMTTNMWDERTSWYVGGAAAAAGALLGGTLGVESDAWRTRYDWE